MFIYPKKENTRKRLNRETIIMKEQRTVTPYGLDNNSDGRD